MSLLGLATSATSTGPRITLTGELDYESAPLLRRHLGELPLESGQRLVLDLAGLAFCDSSGITALLTARQRATQAGARVALAAVRSPVLRIIGILGLDQIFELEELEELEELAEVENLE